MFIRFDCGDKRYALTSNDKTFEICVPTIQTDKETGEQNEVWSGRKFYPTLERAIESILYLKLRHSDAESFKGLLNDLEKAKQELSGLFGVEFKAVSERNDEPAKRGRKTNKPKTEVAKENTKEVKKTIKRKLLKKGKKK